MDGNGEVCLGLGLGLPEFSQKREVPQNKNKRLLFLDLSIPVQQNDHDKQTSFSQDINFSMNFGRKKLKLTRDQTTLLEDSFTQHTTLNTAQKQALAEKLNLKPRQVEVWFQNRRARTKLKQTEVECAMLKKNCERLSEENRRLKKEVLELRSSMEIEKPAAFFHHDHKGAAAAGRGGGGKPAAAVLEVVHHP